MVLSKTQKFFLGFLLLIIIITIGFLYFLSYQEVSAPVRQIELKINNSSIKADVSDNPERRYLGLSNRESLCTDCGMLFVFPDKEIRKFVMRNMNFPLDIIFISDNEIINIKEKLKPEGANPVNVYSSFLPADMVLELNGSFTEKNNIKIGDKILIENIY